MRNKTKLFTPANTDQRGDTIISVLLSVAIASLVIVLAYTLISRSVRYGQQAREREQVKNLIQSQIEGLKNLAATGDSSSPEDIFQFEDGDKFCLSPSGRIIQTWDATVPPSIHVDIRQALPPMPPMKQCDEFSNLKEADVELTITYDKKGSNMTLDSAEDEHLFVVTAEWTRVGDANVGEGILSIPVRIHPINTP